MQMLGFAKIIVNQKIIQAQSHTPVFALAIAQLEVQQHMVHVYA